MGINPVAIFENIELQSTQTLIRDTVRARAGIYMIVNLVTGDYYFGSGITNMLNVRFRKHLITLHGSEPIAVYVGEYGLDNFCVYASDANRRPHHRGYQ